MSDIKVRKVTADELAEKYSIPAIELKKFLKIITNSMTPFSSLIKVLQDDELNLVTVTRKGLGVIKNDIGEFWQYQFQLDDQWNNYNVIIKAEIDEETLHPIFKDKKNLIVRTDSGCATGQLFGDLTCDCSEQLFLAMETINRKGEGIIINIPNQDGRGMGLPFKLATLWLQNKYGLNTIESASLIASNGVIDKRTYLGVVAILKFFGIENDTKINLATNNPDKANIFIQNKYEINAFEKMLIEPNEHTEHHLKAKKEELGHKLN